MKPADFRRELRRAERELSKRDRVLARHIARAVPCDLELEVHFEPFESLLSAIAHQQLNGKAAQTILGRVKERFSGSVDRWPTPQKIAAARMPALRACGLSRAKALAAKDLAKKSLDGTVPAARALHAMDDDAIVERLTAVRGIGRWTVEMMLMFRMGRLDVLPVDDYGVRKGFSQLYRREELVTPKALLQFGERWRPYRSVASWFMWRVLDG